jgi:hypothetical protein
MVFNNGGRDWLQVPGNEGLNWAQIQTSDDGKNLVASVSRYPYVAYSGTVFASRYYCVTWEAQGKVGSFIGATPDGNTFIAVGTYGKGLTSLPTYKVNTH